MAGILGATAEFVDATWHAIGTNAVPLLLWINFASILCGAALTVHCLLLSTRVSRLNQSYARQAALLRKLAIEVGDHNELLRVRFQPPFEGTQLIAPGPAVDAEAAAQIREEIFSLQSELQASAPADQSTARPREVSLRLLSSTNVEPRQSGAQSRPGAKKTNLHGNAAAITLISETS